MQTASPPHNHNHPNNNNSNNLQQLYDLTASPHVKRNILLEKQTYYKRFAFLSTCIENDPSSASRPALLLLLRLLLRNSALQIKGRKRVICIQNQTTATTRIRTSPFQYRDHLERPHRGCVRHRERRVPLCRHRRQPRPWADAWGAERGRRRVEADLGKKTILVK